MADPHQPGSAPSPFDALGMSAWREAKELHLGIGESLVHEGAVLTSIFAVLEGEISSWKHTATGSIELNRLQSGDWVPDLGALVTAPAISSLTAVRPCRVLALEPVRCLQAFAEDSAFTLQWLTVLSRRLQQAETRIAELPDRRKRASTLSKVMPPRTLNESIAAPAAHATGNVGVQVSLEGLTEPAKAALPSNPYVIRTLPCRIGRAGTSDTELNDLVLQDFEPYQLSTDHLLIFQDRRGGEDEGRIGIFDRGSERGSWLNHHRLGGLMGDESATLLDSGSAVLVLGEEDSVFRFRLTVTPI